MQTLNTAAHTVVVRQLYGSTYRAWTELSSKNDLAEVSVCARRSDEDKKQQQQQPTCGINLPGNNNKYPQRRRQNSCTHLLILTLKFALAFTFASEHTHARSFPFTLAYTARAKPCWANGKANEPSHIHNDNKITHSSISIAQTSTSLFVYTHTHMIARERRRKTEPHIVCLSNYGKCFSMHTHTRSHTTHHRQHHSFTIHSSNHHTTPLPLPFGPLHWGMGAELCTFVSERTNK